MKTNIHIQNVRDKMRLSHETFPAWLGISQEDYAHIIYNWGKFALHVIYPMNCRQFSEYHIKLERSRSFWNWFKNECYHIEKGLLQFGADTPESERKKHYGLAMKRTIESALFEESLISFLKTQKDIL